MADPEGTVSAVPVRVLFAIVLAFLLSYLMMAAKAYSVRQGPLLWTVWFRPSHVARDLRAVGLDMLFAALGLQLGLLVDQWFDENRAPVINPLLHSIPPHLSVDQGQLTLWGAVTVVGLILFFTNLIRFLGYEPSGHLREDIGVAVPNLTGIMVIAVVYLLSPMSGSS